MSDRVYASLFYIALIVGSSWVAISVGETLTRATLTKLSLLPSREARPSRVDMFLAAQREAEPAATAKAPLIPPAPSLTVGALAKGMDEAEQVSIDPANEDKAGDGIKTGAVNSEAPKPRVAGWAKRLPKRELSVAAPEETSSHLIMRSLRAEM